MGDVRKADVLLLGHVVTLDPARPTAEAVAVAGGTILAVGSLDDLRAVVSPRTEIVEGGGRLILPAFHDAHLHLLDYARVSARLDCGALGATEALAQALQREDAVLPPAAWLVGHRLDEKQFPNEWLPSRADLDRVVGGRPVRLKHRSLHLDIFNTEGLRRLGLLAGDTPELERDPAGALTGRVYDGALLLHARLPRPGRAEIGADVRRASQRLLSWGVTTVQDASVTNDPERWELLHDLAASGDLEVRVVMLPGIGSVDDLRRARPATSRVRLGPAKIMLSERALDPDALVAQIDHAHRAGAAVAIHAVSETELAVALLALREVAPNAGGEPDRIEHGATIPDEWLPELQAAGVIVVGQPGLVYDRGDQYQREFGPAEHGWLHRARSLVAAGVPYAAGSDAPVTEPSPSLMFHALRRRRTRSGSLLGAAEALDARQALHSMTAEPARAAGLRRLGVLAPGVTADIVVVEPGMLDGVSLASTETALTMLAGQIVWRAGA